VAGQITDAETKRRIPRNDRNKTHLTKSRTRLTTSLSKGTKANSPQQFRAQMQRSSSAGNSRANPGRNLFPKRCETRYAWGAHHAKAENQFDTPSAVERTPQRARLLSSRQPIRREVFGHESLEPSLPHAPRHSTYNSLEKPARRENVNPYCRWASVPGDNSPPLGRTAWI
jgi:hypothetical protein